MAKFPMAEKFQIKNYVLWFGGDNSNDLEAGLWNWNCLRQSSFSSASNCARLLFIKP